jgi:hypothetical protein
MGMTMSRVDYERLKDAFRLTIAKCRGTKALRKAYSGCTVQRMLWAIYWDTQLHAGEGFNDLTDAHIEDMLNHIADDLQLITATETPEHII